MAGPEMTAKAERLRSTDRDDHPAAVDDPPTCAIRYPHGQHAYGRIMPEGGLAHWCRGKG